jgi:pyruvate dehydrogenase E1 component alpha subunit
MTIRYPYKGHGLAGFDRISHSHSAAQLVGWYRAMLRIRRIEEEIERRYHQDLMKTPIHLVIGQEAAAVGCCSALRTTDLVYTSHRTHGAYLAKGGDLGRMLCEMHCRINGCVGSRGGSMHLIDKSVGMSGTSAIVGGAVPIAAGAALAAKMKQDDRVVVVFLGDATTEEGVTAESLNFAALKKLPVIFFCENNFYSVQSPLAVRQRPATSAHGPKPMGCLPTRWTASMSSLYTRQSGRRWREPEPVAARRSSKFRCTGSARTAAPVTTAEPGIAPRPNVWHGKPSIRFTCSATT